MIVNPGIRRFLGSAIQRLFNSASFYAPLTHTLALERGTGSPTFTRASTATVTNNDGYLVTALAGEARFVGARRIYNLWTTSSVSLANGANKSLTLSAGTYAFSMGAGTGTATFSGTGGATGTLAASASGRVSVNKTISAGTFVVTASVADLADLQVESLTAQTTQTAGEYVSVGVESAPYYHGSFVDGVKCFPTDLAGNALPTAYTYDAVSLNGVAGTYVSTPDSVAASITGDIDIRVKVALNDYTPAVENIFVCKNDAANNMAYYWILNGAGTLSFITSTNGTAAVSATSTASTGITDGAVSWIRVIRDVDNGAGGNTTVFYKSSDGVTWAKIGDDVVNVGTTSIYDSAAPLALGMDDRFNAYTLNGKIFSAQIYNGIDGTLAVDFDASRYAGGTTLTGSTGETWTLNGNAVIHPTNSPMRRYSAEGARTNLVWPSEDLTHVRYVSGGGGIAVVADQAVAPDGTTTADQLTASGANGTLIQDLGVIASAAQAFSLYLKRKTGTGNIDITLDGGATWTTQAITTTEWTRCQITQTVANPDVGIRIVTSGDAIYAWGLQCE